KSHGGNDPLISYLMRSHFDKKRDYALMSTAFSGKITRNPAKMYEHFLANRKDYPMLGDEEFAVLKKFADLGSWGGGHADFLETAHIYGCRPELVEPKHFAVANGLTTDETRYLTDLEVTMAGDWGVTHRHSYHGYDPIGCNQALGEAFVKYAAERFAKIVRVLKEDEKCVDMQRSLYEIVESPV
ncbi:MAG: creatininase family protein, partial [Clostridia bacterium]|nr:creatininase family protein [Clostridia bacterium]